MPLPPAFHTHSLLDDPNPLPTEAHHLSGDAASLRLHLARALSSNGMGTLPSLAARPDRAADIDALGLFPSVDTAGGAAIRSPCAPPSAQASGAVQPEQIALAAPAGAGAQTGPRWIPVLLQGPSFSDASGVTQHVSDDQEPMGDLSAARPYREQAVSILESSLGPEHPNTQAGQRNLEVLLDEFGTGVTSS